MVESMSKDTTVHVSSQLTACDAHYNPVLIIGQLRHLQDLDYKDVASKIEQRVPEEVWRAGLKNLHPSPTDSVSLYLNLCTLCALPTRVSRHNSHARGAAITKMVKNHAVPSPQQYIVLIVERSNIYASVCAAARAFSLYSRKSNSTQSKENVTIEFIIVGEESGKISEKDVTMLDNAIESVRLAARIVDTPANEMDTAGFMEEIRAVGEKLNITPYEISGENLKKRGFGGIYGVGKAADVPPVLAVLSHKPPGATQNIAWVGKGIVYDTGGLSIKTKTTMPGMKRDCGGAAGILGAFYLAVSSGFTENLHAVFCLAENAVGPRATKPDDIHTMYSGRTVEINNTDAEGRLVLADGVVFASQDLNCKTILDMATLTGAQATATGKHHAALLTNCEEMERCAVEAGRQSGDLLHPIVYSPELHFTEFSSCVADMKNSIADRSNAASSCAGLFILSHLGFDFPGKWLHVDMAAPVCVGERATGYGAALLPKLFGQYSDNELLKALAPALPQQKNGEEHIDGEVDGVASHCSKKTRLA